LQQTNPGKIPLGEGGQTITSVGGNRGGRPTIFKTNFDMPLNCVTKHVVTSSNQHPKKKKEQSPSVVHQKFQGAGANNGIGRDLEEINQRKEEIRKEGGGKGRLQTRGICRITHSGVMGAKTKRRKTSGAEKWMPSKKNRVKKRWT